MATLASGVVPRLAWGQGAGWDRIGVLAFVRLGSPALIGLELTSINVVPNGGNPRRACQRSLSRPRRTMHSVHAAGKGPADRTRECALSAVGQLRTGVIHAVAGSGGGVCNWIEQ